MTLSTTNPRARQRWTLLSVAVVTLIMAFGAITLAVHDAGNIQLDGNAITDATSPVGNGDEDWDLICKAHSATATPPKGECVPTTSPSGTTTASASEFILDAFGQATDDVYTTGGSKDDLDIGSWKFKNAAPSPDKADLEHAMAALYSNGSKFVYFGADRFTNNGDVNIAFWFFQDEVKENGDGGATPSDPPDPTLCSSGSGCSFAGTHVAHGPGPDGYICYPGMAGYNAIETQTGLADQACTAFGGPGADDTRGDILVVSAFTGGGVQPNIEVYEWVGLTNAPNLAAQGSLPKKDLKVTSNRSVVRVPIGQATLSEGCASTGLTNDPACAIVNTGELSGHPWAFLDKGTGSTNPQQGEFFEGGLNLTALGFGDTCFSSFLVNTRSSQSVDSVLHDFALGQLGSCRTTLTTTASLNGVSSSINNGSTAANGTASSGTDSATLTVNGVSTWGGQLKFYLCGPLTSTAVCTDGGVLVSDLTVSQATTQPIASGDGGSDGVNDGRATLTAAGRYCWYAAFTPDAATAAKGVTGATHDGSGGTSNLECFTISPVTPTLDTDAGDGPVDFGQAVTDTATLSNAAKEPGSNGANTTYPTINATNGAFVGTIGFTLKGPDGGTPACSTTNAQPYSGETQTFPITRTVTGNGTYGDGSPAATDPVVSYIPAAPGTYHWVAVYSHTSATVNNNLPVTHNATCTDADESVTVRQIPTVISTRQFVFPQDKVKIDTNPSGTQALAGNVVFKLFGPTGSGDTAKTALQNCQADTATGLVYSEGPITISGTGPQYATTDNRTFRITASGTTYVWRVTYTSTATSQTGSTSECVESTAVTYAGNDTTIAIP